ncbi:MAG TPA: NAD(P)-dependent oxidoreductase, partial [bacterium]|nr:NAD(P)-dependent oxidoreductase [bacterium]
LSSHDEVIRVADILSLHMNLSETTRGLINRARLASMKKGAIIINCARGGIVDQQALGEALISEAIAGYGCDVLEHEPPEPDNPLIGLENVVVTPHIGSRTYESVARQAEMATRNLILVLNKKPPLARFQLESKELAK